MIALGNQDQFVIRHPRFQGYYARKHTLKKQIEFGKYLANSFFTRRKASAAIAPAVERTLGKGEVACSNHAGSTTFSRQTVLKRAPASVLFLVNKAAFMLKNAVARWPLALLSNKATKVRVEACL